MKRAWLKGKDSWFDTELAREIVRWELNTDGRLDNRFIAYHTVHGSIVIHSSVQRSENGPRDQWWEQWTPEQLLKVLDGLKIKPPDWLERSVGELEI